MNRLDRYLFLQLLGPFGFFTLALAGILWLAQALPLIELVIDNGRAGIIFLEFSALILPNVLIIVFPFSAFIATIYTINRMFGDSEMVVVMSAGLSPLKIAKPVAVFGLFVMGLMYVLVMVLQPIANTRLGDKTDALKQDTLATLLLEKQFMHPMAGVTIYLRESSNVGEISGLFLHDQRDIDNPTTYSAHNALLLQDETELRLVMSEGDMQRYDTSDNTLSTVEFDQFVFDLTEVMANTRARNRRPIEYKVSELLRPKRIIRQGGRRNIAVYFAEAHNKISLPLLAFVLPMIAVGLMLSAKYRRSGFGIRITIVSVVGMLIVALTVMAKTRVIDTPDIYWISYIPAAGAALFAAFILLQTSWRGGKTFKYIEGSA